ncbi:MAG: substrate-binding domain-containing protein, partial [Clostridiales bacterium]|nr:substrate-binding domain-containing protein [Clostridiales bacterium]
LKSHGVRVPEDISVVGFDNIFISEMVQPALTTVDQPQYEMGKLAANLLFESLSNKRGKHLEIRLKPSLIIRDSTQRS